MFLTFFDNGSFSRLLNINSTRYIQEVKLAALSRPVPIFLLSEKDQLLKSFSTTRAEVLVGNLIF
jgi:hypothetical protein